MIFRTTRSSQLLLWTYLKATMWTDYTTWYQRTQRSHVVCSGNQVWSKGDLFYFIFLFWRYLTMELIWHKSSEVPGEHLTWWPHYFLVQMVVLIVMNTKFNIYLWSAVYFCPFRFIIIASPEDNFEWNIEFYHNDLELFE